MGRCGFILIILLSVSSNLWAGIDTQVVHQLRRMADAQEDESKIKACEFLIDKSLHSFITNKKQCIELSRRVIEDE